MKQGCSIDQPKSPNEPFQHFCCILDEKAGGQVVQERLYYPVELFVLLLGEQGPVCRLCLFAKYLIFEFRQPRVVCSECQEAIQPERVDVVGAQRRCLPRWKEKRVSRFARRALQTRCIERANVGQLPRQRRSHGWQVYTAL